ncbi:MAG: hypothetical protein ACI81Q_000785 [Paracoccaceae bacterium]|jgi:uncharacterized protein (DUF427 family)
MSDYITIRQVPGKWVVRANGAVLAESANAVQLVEGSHQPVIYFPRSDIGMAFFERTDKTSHCPHKGDATYFTISTVDGTLPNAAWSYETPLSGAQGIEGHLAFYSDRVTVEQL